MSTNSHAAQTLVVGGGVLGTAIADELAGAGHDVVLVEARRPGHPQSASGDTTRILRSGYGSSTAYTRWAWEAHTDWSALEERTGEQLILRTGVTWLATGDGRFEEDTYRELSEQGIPVKRLAPKDITGLYPSINTGDVSYGVFE